MYRVLMRFCDSQDNNYVYSVGDTFPRNGVEVDAERIAELASDKNRLGIPLIEEIPKKPKKKAVKKVVETEE